MTDQTDKMRAAFNEFAKQFPGLDWFTFQIAYKFGESDGLQASRTDADAGDDKRCQYCDGTGDVHDQTGEWRGECTECDSRNAKHVDGLDDMLRDVERVMAKNIYPKPDAGPEHPWSVLKRLREYRAKLAQRGEPK